MQLADALQELLLWSEQGGLEELGSLGLVEFLQGFERLRNRMSLVDHAAITVADRQGTAAELGQASVKTVLVHALRLSPTEASRRVRAAAAVGERLSAVGEVLPAARPHLAAAQRTGELSPEQVAVIERALAGVDVPGLDPTAVERAEQTLARHALTFGPQELRTIAVHLVDRINPDGSVTEDQLHRDRREIRLTRCPDGSYRLEGRLTPALGAQLHTVLTPLARPRTSSADGPRGGMVEQPDPRRHGQRMHDALDDVCARLLRSGGLPASGGTPAAVIVTIDYADLLGKTGHGTTTDGTAVSAAEVLRLANEAEILPTVLTSCGEPLELGRSRRIASSNQTYALIARDGGCSFPACSHPPEWSDRHHIVGWLAGGRTDLSNLTLLCRYHHTHYLGHGWTCRMSDHQLPEWIPPRWVDPEQRPLVNDRIRAKHVPAA